MYVKFVYAISLMQNSLHFVYRIFGFRICLRAFRCVKFFINSNYRKKQSRVDYPISLSVNGQASVRKQKRNKKQISNNYNEAAVENLSNIWTLDNESLVRWVRIVGLLYHRQCYCFSRYFPFMPQVIACHICLFSIFHNHLW